MSSLKAQTQKAAMLQLSVRIVLFIGTFLQQIFLARILDPSVFGLVALTFLTLTFLSVFSETGVAGSIILEQEVGDNILNFAWTMQVIRGLFLGGILILAAPVVATIFREPELIPLVRALSITPVIGGLASPRLLTLRRELQYGKLSSLVLIEFLVRLVTSIPLALMWRSAWALLVAAIAAAIVRTVVSYLLVPHASRFIFSRELAGRFSSFGRWAFLNSILHYLINESDKLIIGRLLSTTSVGLYQMAFRIGNLPFSELGNVISEVAFPAYRKAESHVARAFLRVFGLTVVVTTPLAIGLAVIAPDLVDILLGETWSEVTVPLQILCVFGVFRSINSTTGPLFYGLGRPDIQSSIAGTYTVILWIVLIPATLQWGVTGTATAVLISSVLMVPFIFYQLFRLINVNLWETMKLALVPVTGATVMGASVILLMGSIGDSLALMRVATGVLAGAVIYTFWILLAERLCGYDGARPVRELMISTVKRAQSLRRGF